MHVHAPVKGLPVDHVHQQHADRATGDKAVNDADDPRDHALDRE